MHMFKFQAMGLVLASAIALPAVAKPWKSGEIVGTEKFLYGAFEARLKASVGSSAITAFFLINEPSSEWQELDFEVFGKDPYKFQSQVMTPGDPRTQNLIEHSSSSKLSDDFHSYRIEWTPDYLAFYFDGQQIRKETDRNTYGKFLDSNRVEPMAIRASLWAGFSSWSGMIDPNNLPSAVEIDSIRVYSYNRDRGSFDFKWEDQFDGLDANRWQKADWTFEYAVTDYKPENVFTKDGHLVLNFTN